MTLREIIHPYAIGNGEADERELAATAKRAAEALLTPGQIEWAQKYELHLLPASVHRPPNVQLVGIARLRYRPHTKATAACGAKKSEWASWTERFGADARSATSRVWIAIRRRCLPRGTIGRGWRARMPGRLALRTLN
jgi:hypothetical protein